MWKKELIENRILAVLIILLGALTIPIEWDVSVFVFTLIIGVYLFFQKKNWVY